MLKIFMVEITTTSLMDRTRNWLGLRGKAIVSSRNSLYPVVVVNSNQQAIPIRPTTVPNEADVRITLSETTLAANQNYTVIYTVPVGKVFFLIGYHTRDDSGTIITAIRNVANSATVWRLGSMDAAGDQETMSPVSIRLSAGMIIAYYSGAGAAGFFYYYGWEENA